jgi:hypothetical protein
MVATEVLVLLHVPPAVKLLRVVVDPTHTPERPVLGVREITVTVVDEEQPAPNE